MKLPAAYISIIIIWSTTPLAIQWSSTSSSYSFSVFARMLIGLVMVLTMLIISGQRLPNDRKALHTYLAGGLGIYGAMSLVYWGAQHIPSGWISLVFGLSPIITTVLSALFYTDTKPGYGTFIAQGLGLSGLGIIFISAIELHWFAVTGLTAVLFSTIIHSASALMVKHINAEISPLASVAGSLSFAVPVFYLTWLVLDGELPIFMTPRQMISILYLGIIATAAGFAMYYYILKNLSAIKVAMITLIAPVAALYLGYHLNHEEISIRTAMGTAIIIFAMLAHEFIHERAPDSDQTL